MTSKTWQWHVSNHEASPATLLKFYQTLLHGISLLILAGFVPSYWLQFAGLSSSHHSHAALAFCWLLLLNIQPLLIRRGFRFAHRLLGRAAFAVAIVLVLSTLNLFVMTFPQRFNSQAIFTLAYTLDLFLLPAYTLCVLMAYIHRKQLLSHVSFLLLSTVMLLPPGIGRLIYGVFLLPFAAPQRYFFEPMIASTFGLFLYIGYQERWQRHVTLWLAAGLIVATLLAYGVTYGLT